MTREEAVKMLKSKMDGHTDISYEWAETVRMAIKALEQKPCDDCINRDKTIVQLNHLLSNFDDEGYLAIRKCIETIKSVPSVTPQQKMGKWKRISSDMYVQHAMAYYECSECGKKMIGTHNHCPNCGCKMQESC